MSENGSKRYVLSDAAKFDKDLTGIIVVGYEINGELTEGRKLGQDFLGKVGIYCYSIAKDLIKGWAEKEDNHLRISDAESVDNYKKLGDNVWLNTNANPIQAIQRAHELCIKANVPCDSIFVDLIFPDDLGGSAGTPVAEPPGAEVQFKGCNLVISGVPGSGKSHFVSHELVADCNGRVFRTVFHPEYTNSDFVGQLIPVRNDAGQPDYRFVPGPFTRALECAYRNRGCKVALIIEELNRGDCASIFGEVFQLLDRQGEGSPSPYESEYGITSVPVIDYFNKGEGKGSFDHEIGEVKIPANLYLYATMNTSDQNVYPIDTAFNRRWAFFRYPNNFGKEQEKYYLPHTDINWRLFAEKVNDLIIGKKIQNAEDKQLGRYFVRHEDALDTAAGEPAGREIDDMVMRLSNKGYVFANKVLGYLWNDVFRNNRGVIFQDPACTMDKMIRTYIEKGKEVFSAELLKSLSSGDSDVPPAKS